MNWYIRVLKNYFNFSGRARRKEYWMFMLFNFIFSILAILIDTVLGGSPGDGIIYSLYSLAVLIPSISVSARRLHDVGRSGWWLLIGLVPLIGWIPLLYWAIKDGVPEANDWGRSEKYA